MMEKNIIVYYSHHYQKLLKKVITLLAQISLAQTKAGNNSNNLKFRQIVYPL